MSTPTTYEADTKKLTTEELLTWALQTFSPKRLVLASSFSIEDQLLTWMFLSQEKNARIFTLDTGRLFQETYDVMDYTLQKYNYSCEVGFPDAAELAPVIAREGPNFFRTSVEARKECCRIRKTEPLKKILYTADCWITGLRREQAPTRTSMKRVEWDNNWNIWKINPLLEWSEQEVWEIIHRENIPFNPLQKKGFRSLGCACCTRAIGPDEDIRAGRWWWEDPEHKECGLHKQ